MASLLNLVHPLLTDHAFRYLILALAFYVYPDDAGDPGVGGFLNKIVN